MLHFTKYDNLKRWIFFFGLFVANLRYISMHYQLLRLHGFTDSTTPENDFTPQQQLSKSGIAHITSTVTATATTKSTSSSNDPKYGFGACLMVKDDNDLLYEWIAYHYTVLSLRYLVIGSDIGSLQNASDVLNRWNNVNLTADDSQLRYWILQPEDFIYRHHRPSVPSSTPQDLMPSSMLLINDTDIRRNINVNTENDHHHALVDRQKGFVTVCSEMLKAAGVAWTLYIDSDEFVVWNPLSNDEEAQLQTNIQQRNAIQNRSYTIRKNFTESNIQSSKRQDNTSNYYDLIRQLQNQNDVSECYTMPRLLVGALENRTCPDRYGVKEVQKRARQQLGHRFTQMSTLRYFQHAKKGDFTSSKYGKVMMDLTRIDTQTIRTKPRNIHRPYTQHCASAGGVYFPNAYFFILHYIGSWERYISRGSNDRRRNRDEWEHRAYVDDGSMSACDSTVHHWMFRFEQLVGEFRTNYLLGVT